MKKLITIFAPLFVLFLTNSAFSQNVIVNGQEISTAGDRIINNDDLSDYENVTITFDSDIDINTYSNPSGSEGLLNFGDENISFSGDFTITNDKTLSYNDNSTTETGGIVNLNDFGSEIDDDLTLIINNQGQMKKSNQSVNSQSVIHIDSKAGANFSTIINNEGEIEGARAIYVNLDPQSESSLVINNNNEIITGDSQQGIYIKNGGSHILTNNGIIDSSGKAIVFEDAKNVTINNSVSINSNVASVGIEILGDTEIFTLNLGDDSTIAGNNSNAVRSQADLNILGVNSSSASFLYNAYIDILGDNNVNDDVEYAQYWDQIIIGEEGSATLSNERTSIAVTEEGVYFGDNLEEGAELINNGLITITNSGSFSIEDTSFTNNGIIDGSISFNNATLLNNGTVTGSINVGSGSKISGSGTFSNNLSLANGSIIEPGNNGVGNMRVEGDLSLFNGSVANFEYGLNGLDMIIVDGEADIDGTLNISPTAFDRTQRVVVSGNLIEADGGVSGQFDQINLVTQEDYIYDMNYSENAVSLNLVPELNSNVVDSRLIVANDALRITARQAHNEFVRRNVNRNNFGYGYSKDCYAESGDEWNFEDQDNCLAEEQLNKYRAWVSADRLNFDRDANIGFDENQNEISSNQFEGVGDVISAGIIVSDVDLISWLDLNLDVGLSAFKSYSNIFRGYYDGTDDIDMTGATFNIGRNFDSSIGDIYFLLGATYADIELDSMRDVNVNGVIENAHGDAEGKYSAVTLGLNYQISLNQSELTKLNFSAISSLQRTEYESYEETGLSGGNINFGEYSLETFNVEGLISIQQKFNRFLIIPQDTMIEVGALIYNSQILNEEFATIGLVGIDSESSQYVLHSNYQGDVAYGYMGGISLPLSDNLSIRGRYELRESDIFRNEIISAGLTFDF